MLGIKVSNVNLKIFSYKAIDLFYKNVDWTLT